MRPVRCVQKHRANVVKVPDSECPPDTAPNTVEKCNRQHCPARYKVTVLLNVNVWVNIHRPQNMQDMQEIKTKKSHYLLIVMLSPQNISETL